MDKMDQTLLTRLLGPGATEKDVTAAAEKIKELAFREWMDWMSGLYRPISISQNNIDRIAKIYGAVVGDVRDIERQWEGGKYTYPAPTEKGWKRLEEGRLFG